MTPGHDTVTFNLALRGRVKGQVVIPKDRSVVLKEFSNAKRSPKTPGNVHVSSASHRVAILLQAPGLLLLFEP